MNSARRRRRSWARFFLFKCFYFLTQCVDFICAAKTKASLRLWQLHFKINEVSRLSGHTFSCPGTGTDARSRVQSTGSSLARATHMLSPCPAARLFDCSLSPLSDCNLLFRFICQNIFPVPFFDTGGRDGNCRKTDESWEWERTASEHNNGCNSCNLQLHCCAYILGKFAPYFAFVQHFGHYQQLPFHFHSLATFQLITSGHKWIVFNGGYVFTCCPGLLMQFYL